MIIDDIDKGIALDAYEDCELVRNTVRQIAVNSGVSNEQALEEFCQRFEKLAKILPLRLYFAEKPFGRSDVDAPIEISISVVMDPKGEVVGPPYLHYSTTLHAMNDKHFADFFDKYGLPEAIT